MAIFYWNANAGRFRGEDGRFISPTVVRGGLDDYLDAKGAQLRALAQQLQRREISIATFQDAMRQELFHVHLNAGALANGGNRQLGDKELNAIGAKLRSEFAYLDRLGKQVEQGLPLDGRFLNRVASYAQAGRGFYESERQAGEYERGAVEERSVRHATDSCKECIYWERAGWQPPGTVPMPGDRECRNGCKCTLEYQ